MVHRGARAQAVALELLGQLGGGIAHRPGGVGVDAVGVGLVGVHHPPEIGVLGGGVGPPDVVGVLAGPAEAGGVDGLGQLAVIADDPAGGLAHRPHTDLAGTVVGPAAHAVVGLAGGGAADVKAVAVMLAQVFQHIGPGKDRLGFQRLQGPVPAHLKADHAVDIVLQGQDVDDGDISAAAPVVLEAPPVLIVLEPCAGLPHSGDIGLNGQPARLAAVVLKQNLAGARLYHAHAVGACPHHASAGDAFQCR